MHRFARPSCLAAAFAAFLLGQPAAAGPISWTYTTTVTTGDLSLRVDFGWLPITDPATGLATPHYYSALLSQPQPTGAFDGPARWRITGFGLQDIVDRTSPNPPGSTNEPHITVMIRDEASGEMGQVSTSTLVGVSLDNNTGQLFPGIGYNLIEHPLVLGGNRYAVNFRSEQDGREAWFVAEVGIRPAAETPEPPTAALAVAGVAVGFGRWRRRRA